MTALIRALGPLMQQGEPLTVADLNPAAWYEAQLDSAGSTITDQSGNGRDLTQVSTFSASYVTSVINGKAVWRCVNTEFAAASNWASGWTAGELFMVVEADNDPGVGAPGAPFDMSGQNTSGQHYPWSDSQIFDSWGSTIRRSFNPAPSLSSFHLFNARNDGTTNGHLYVINGTTIQTYTDTVSFVRTPRLGAQTYSSTRRAWPGDIALILVFDKVLSSGQRAVVHSYVETEYGLTIA